MTLAKAMRNAGYCTAAIVGGFPMSSRFGVGQGFETYDDQFPPPQRLGGEAERKAEEVSRRGIAWLEQHADQPFFLFLHYYDAHYPYDPPPPFPATYDGELAYTDEWVGKVMDKLRDLGLYDNTLVVLVGDHGEGLSEHGEKEHGFLIYQNTLSVPMIVRAPGGPAGTAVDENASLIDVVPTVLGLTHLSPAKQVEGADLSGYLTAAAPNELPGRSTASRCGPNCTNAVRSTASSRAIGSTFGPQSRSCTTSAATAEKRTTSSTRSRRLPAGCGGQLDQWQKAMAATAKPQSDTDAALPKDTMQQLESLGYVGGGSGAADSGADLKLEDPKDFVAIFEHCKSATELKGRRAYEEARKELLEVVSRRPKMVLAHYLLGEIATTAIAISPTPCGSIPRPCRSWPRPRIRQPLRPAEAKRKQAMHCHMGLGRALLIDGKPDRAIVAYQTAFQMDPERLRGQCQPHQSARDPGTICRGRGPLPQGDARPVGAEQTGVDVGDVPGRGGAQRRRSGRNGPPVGLRAPGQPGPGCCWERWPPPTPRWGGSARPRTWRNRALTLAKMTGQTLARLQLQAQLELYRAGRPCREAGAPPPQQPGGSSGERSE